MNGRHIHCCHTVGSVALGSLKLGVFSALTAGAIGFVGKRLLPKRIKWDAVFAAVAGYLGFFVVYKGAKAYSDYCFREAMRKNPNINYRYIKPIQQQ